MACKMASLLGGDFPPCFVWFLIQCLKLELHLITATAQISIWLSLDMQLTRSVIKFQDRKVYEISF
jgi:hypothetical protein